MYGQVALLNNIATDAQTIRHGLVIAGASIVNLRRRLLRQGLLLALQIVAPPGAEQRARQAADWHSGAGCDVTSEHAY